MTKAFFLLVLSFLYHIGFGQMLMNRDSLLRQLPSAKEDTAKVFLLINIGQQYENNEPATAKQYYAEAGQLSEKLDFPLGILKYIANYTYILNMQGLYDSSLLLNKRAVEISRQIKDSLFLGKALFNTGTSYRQLGNYEAAIGCYEEGKAVFARVGDEHTMGQSYDILQVTYYQMRRYEKGIEYGKMAVSKMREYKDSAWLGFTLNNLGVNYMGVKNLAAARTCYMEALAIAQKTGDRNSEMMQYLNLGDLLLQKGTDHKMMTYYSTALEIARELDAKETSLVASKGMAIYYMYQKKYPHAKAYADSALALSYQYNYRIERRDLFGTLSNLAFAMQDIRLGESYAEQSSLLADSLLNERVEKNTQELEKKYETARKESQIQNLETNKKAQELSISRKNILNILLFVGIAALLIISLLLYRSYRVKQALQQQRITELETEKQLTATEAVLKGEEQERTRLAKDLHDGLGGMLSGIKFSFTTIKEGLILTPENAEAFERGMDMLDSSIQEMRRVAHNMMPEALVKFGLDTALEDFSRAINRSGVLQVHYQSIGLEEATLPQTVANASYRIVQELVNNIIKHAAAGRATIQISQKDNQLSLTVEDNGKGFDTATLADSKGIGWSNIKNRVAFLKGTIDIKSTGGKGTSIFIQFNT
jgi:two-component system NarL family sensor kinase